MKENAEHLSLAKCDAMADTRIRLYIFLLTTHHWEGGWLIDIRQLLRKLSIAYSLEKDLRRCIVAERLAHMDVHITVSWPKHEAASKLKRVLA